MSSKETAIIPELGLVKAWSYSTLKAYEKCPQQIYLTKVKKLSKDIEPSAALLKGIAVHAAAEQYVDGTNRGDLPKSLSNFSVGFRELARAFDDGDVEVEGEWAFTVAWENTGYFARDCWVRFKLDAIVKESDTSFRVIDYKTGRSFGNELEHQSQLMLYAVAVFHKHPEAQFVDAEIWYLDDSSGHKLQKSYTREIAMGFKANWVKRGLKMTQATEFPPKPSKFNCRWCDHRKSGVCEDAVD